MNSILLFITGCLAGGTVTGFFVSSRLRRQLWQKESELIKVQAELEALNKGQKDLNDVSQVMTEKFEFLASKIFDEKSQKISDIQRKDLTLLLEPFKERLKDFEKKVEDVYSQEKSERGSLRGELSKLLELNLRMSSDAQNLSRALKGDNRAMGHWGELLLENILEKSGLRKDEEYVIQGTDFGTLRNDKGDQVRPDVIVNLPDSKHLIIDSKVSMTAYDTYINSNDELERETAAKSHVESLKRHIDSLSDKKYHSSDKVLTPDFVILFMPLEPAFALAFKYKPDLLQYAWEKNIALVSPTTLLTTLRTVGTLWKQERQEKNAREIAERGGLLYDKFVGFVEDLEDLGKKLETAQKSHSQVMKKLSQGTGNLISQVDKLRELGAKADKKLLQRIDS